MKRIAEAVNGKAGSVKDLEGSSTRITCIVQGSGENGAAAAQTAASASPELRAGFYRGGWAGGRGVS